MRHKKSYAVKMTPPDWTDEERVAYAWCISNEIKISANAKSSGHNELWDIIISINQDKIVSPKSYGPKDLFPKMLELYKFYYKKYKK